VVTLVYAQQPLQPITLVNTAKNKQANFERASLFKPAQQGASDLARQLSSTEFTPLQLDEEALSKTLGERPEALQISLPFPGRQEPITLELVKVDIFAEGFQVVLASTGQPARVQHGAHYRGVVKGEDKSIAAISMFEGEMMGLLSIPKLGNLVLGKLEGSRSGMEYVLYQDAEVLKQFEFDCATSDDGPEYSPEQLQAPVMGRSAQDKCTNIYLEIDNDVYQSKGGVDGTTNFMTGLFNQVMTLYANESLSIRLSELYLWDGISPYAGSNSFTLLTQFVEQRPSFNGDLGQLISYQASGGIAYLAGLCSEYSPNHSFSSINATYATVPTYSFSVMVIAHELGHLFGSRHTHACAWNGNNTAIDGCAGITEGSCPDPGIPSNGGTIMSYCHIRSTGINFSKGFGTQPGNLIRNAVNTASCLAACQTDNDDDNPTGNDENGCEGQEVELSITVDIYGIETTWEVRDEAGELLHEGGPYPNTSNGTVVNERFCLPEGCYEFTIFDAYGDGICCGYGTGNYELRDSSGALIVEGGQFEAEEKTDFCLPLEGGGTDDCKKIDFNEEEIVSFGGAQDAGTHQLLNDGEVLRLQYNAWKAIEGTYDVTPNTVIEVEFGSTLQGEIHGIGFDGNNSISANRTFRLHGIQNWGIGDFDEYAGDANWQKFTIPVGEYYTGVFDYLFFVADHDRSPRNGDAFFRNIVIYESEPCEGEGTSGDDSTASLVSVQSAPAQQEVSMEIYPNPAQDWLTVHLQLGASSTTAVQIFNMSGQLLQQRQWQLGSSIVEKQLDVSQLTPGTYVLKVTADQQQLVKRFTVSRF
jgi:hypothetical protein